MDNQAGNNQAGNGTITLGNMTRKNMEETPDYHVPDCLRHTNNTTLRVLLNEIKETSTSSYWNKELGKTPYNVPLLPKGMDAFGVTFGTPTIRVTSVAECLKYEPAKSYCHHDEHEMYKLSHSHYDPGERIDYKYDLPYDPSLRYGKTSKADHEGRRTKILLTEHKNLPIAKSVDKHQVEKRCPLDKNILESEKSNKKSNKGVFTVGDTLRECVQDSEVEKQKKCIKDLNVLRMKLKQRYPPVDFLDLRDKLDCYSRGCQEETITLCDFYVELARMNIRPDKKSFEFILDRMKWRNDENVKYIDALNLLDWKKDFPTLPKIDDLPANCLHYSTSTRDAFPTTRCHVEQGNSAGIPSVRFDLKHITTRQDRPSLETVHLSEETSVCELVAPNLFTQLNINYIDLFKPRSKEEIRLVFEKLVKNFPQDVFENMWKTALNDSGSGVSIKTFKSLFDQYVQTQMENDKIY